MLQCWLSQGRMQCVKQTVVYFYFAFHNTKLQYRSKIMVWTMRSDSADPSLTQLYPTMCSMCTQISGPQRRLTPELSVALEKSWVNKLSASSSPIWNFWQNKLDPAECQVPSN
jgi:hypothetical protein